ncbi:Ger(x)C family spore germination protein [Gottfriedia acidiceleris]|uniref:Ger(X)C family spore germination protein n=1 Tax=Gottfriedia acidiceleris TaxID=371036 RepID=A0ABY4JNI7_9BACI|nr:Ger(x)C family spore germination protein [Gottfriedia acidiceleris]UPM55408.1 Ger(x)C family spore germination protein [Gottfriedia acidiceleris]
MKRIKIAVVSLLLFVLLTGCKKTVNIEDITMGLILGIDTDEQNEQLKVFMSSPVFSEEAEEKNEQIVVDATSIREARNLIDTRVTGVSTAGKLQALLVSKKLIKNKTWTSLLDLFYRDAKFRQNADLVYFDGSVSELEGIKQKDKPRLSIFIPQLIETADFRNVTIRTSIRMFHLMEFEKGITPYLPRMSIKDGELEVSGVALLDRHFLVKRTLSIQETQLLRMLQGKKTGQLIPLITIAGEKKGKENNQLINLRQASFNVKDIKRKVDCKFEHNHFDFKIALTIPIMITQSPFPLSDKVVNKLSNEIRLSLEKDLNKFVQNLQGDEVDPIGLGILASSYEHKQWKKVKPKWPEALKDSKIHVKAKIIIVDKGISM